MPLGRPKSKNPRVYCGYRLPAETRDAIKRLSRERSASGIRVSEADVIVWAVDVEASNAPVAKNITTVGSVLPPKPKPKPVPFCAIRLPVFKPGHKSL